MKMVGFDYFYWYGVVGRPMCAGHYSRPLKFSRDRSTLAPSAPLGVRALSPRQSQSIC